MPRRLTVSRPSLTERASCIASRCHPRARISAESGLAQNLEWNHACITLAPVDLISGVLASDSNMKSIGKRLLTSLGSLLLSLSHTANYEKLFPRNRHAKPSGPRSYIDLWRTVSSRAPALQSRPWNLGRFPPMYDHDCRVSVPDGRGDCSRIACGGDDLPRTLLHSCSRSDRCSVGLSDR